MPRPLRIEYPGAWYHVLNRGANRQAVFLNKQDRDEFFNLLKRAVDLLKIRVHAYNLMSNHYHLLVDTPLDNLSRVMHYIGGVYTQRFNRRHGRDGPLFRGRFKSILIEKESYLLELVRYIHLNGVKALQYSQPHEDPYSSHRAYLNHRERPSWLTTQEVLSYFGKHPIQARENLDDFVERGVPEKLAKVLGAQKWPSVLGSESFISFVEREFVKEGDPSLREEKELSRTLSLAQERSPQEVLERVAQFFHVDVEAIVRSSRGRKCRTREMAMYLLRHECRLPYAKIGKLMGGISYGAVAQICLRLESEKSRWKKLAEEIVNGANIFNLRSDP